MTLILDLPTEVEAALRAEAEVQGRPAEDLVIEVVAQAFAPSTLQGLQAPTQPQTIAELLAGRIGKFTTPGPSDASERTREAFAEAVAERHRQGRL